MVWSSSYLIRVLLQIHLFDVSSAFRIFRLKVGFRWWRLLLLLILLLFEGLLKFMLSLHLIILGFHLGVQISKLALSKVHILFDYLLNDSLLSLILFGLELLLQIVSQVSALANFDLFWFVNSVSLFSFGNIYINILGQSHFVGIFFFLLSSRSTSPR